MISHSTAKAGHAPHVALGGCVCVCALALGLFRTISSAHCVPSIDSLCVRACAYASTTTTAAALSSVDAQIVFTHEKIYLQLSRKIMTPDFGDFMCVCLRPDKFTANLRSGAVR